MSMPQFPIPMLDTQKEEQESRSAAEVTRLHDSTLLREIRSHPRPVYAGLPRPVSRCSSNSSTDALALKDVLRDIRGQVRPQLTPVDSDDDPMVEFQLRCRARRQRYTDTQKESVKYQGPAPKKIKEEQEPRPFLSPVKSQMRVLRSHHSSSSHKLKRAKSSSEKKQEIKVDFSTRTGSPRKKILEKDAKQIMEQMVGLSVVDEQEESNTRPKDEDKENSLDFVGPTMPCKLPPLRRRNAIHRKRAVRRPLPR